jgi:hypothetical protein
MMFSILENKFVECPNSLTIVMEEWEKIRVLHVHLRENVIQWNNWKENMYTKMMNLIQ